MEESDKYKPDSLVVFSALSVVGFLLSECDSVDLFSFLLFTKGDGRDCGSGEGCLSLGDEGTLELGLSVSA